MTTEASFEVYFETPWHGSFDDTVWRSPSVAELDWSNCTAIADYWAEWINIVNENEPDINLTWGNLGKLIGFLSAALPQGWTPAPNPIHLAAWYWYVWNNNLFINDPEFEAASYALDDALINQCRPEVCNALDIQGDPDVSGPGMMGSYYVAAALSTVYFVVLFVKHLYGNESDSRLFAAFKNSANTFLDAMLIFTAAILASTVARYSSFARHHSQGDLEPDAFSSYQLIGAVALSVFCVFPCLVLQTVAGGLQVRTVSGERRIRFLRLFLWVVIVALTITVDVQYDNVYTQLWDNITNITTQSMTEHAGLYREWWWISHCDDVGLLFQIITTITAGHAILGLQLVWLAYYLAAYALMRLIPVNQESPFKGIKDYQLRGKSINDHWKLWQPFVRLINGVMCGIVMWVLLVLFTVYRNHLRSIAAQTNLDGRWTFGQVLSLFTWVPVVLEWLVIFFSDSETGLDQKLPDTYHATKISENQSPQEIRSMETTN